jgi:hypothetical protein
MPVSKSRLKNDKKSKSSSSSGAQIDVVFVGPLLLVPEVSKGKISGVEVFSPCNGHPIGALFVPGVLFSDEELNDPACERWPDAQGFSLLDAHSYSIDLTQSSSKARKTLPVSSIPGTNHKVRPGRRLSSDWNLAIAVKGSLSRWSSHRLSQVGEGLFHGADTPKSEATASLHRLSYKGITSADLFGAAREPREYLQANAQKGGTLIVIGEIPYQSTLLHERQAIEAIAKLAGLDLHLAETSPRPFRTRMMSHVASCGHSIILSD